MFGLSLTHWGAIAALIVTLGLSIYANGRSDGRAGAVAKIEASNTKAHGKADTAERDVLACPPGKWNREASKCAP